MQNKISKKHTPHSQEKNFKPHQNIPRDESFLRLLNSFIIRSNIFLVQCLEGKLRDNWRSIMCKS